LTGGQQVLAPPKGNKERDVPLPESVALRLGHASAAITLDVYSHVMPDVASRMMAAIDAAMTAETSVLRYSQ
jgi:hypothetical protein